MARVERKPITSVDSEAELRVELARAREEVAALRGQLLEAEQRIAAIPDLEGRSAELERLRASISWRLTAPLRALGRRPAGILLRLQGTLPGQVITRLLQALRR
jgi:hypothetical protein